MQHYYNTIVNLLKTKKSMSRYFFLTLSLIVASVYYSVQAQHTHNHNHNHSHVHGSSEVGLALGLVPLIGEDELTGGMHIHYIRGLTKNGKFGMGLSFETIFHQMYYQF